MKTKSLFNKTALAASIAVSSTLMMAGSYVHAGPWAGTQSGAVSGYEHIVVGVSNIPFGPHSSGNAGVGTSNFPLFGTTAKVDFEGLKDGLTGPIYNLNFPITESPDTHDELGVFTFAQAGDGDVWYGEWSENGNTPANGSTYNGRQVYYYGDNADTDVIVKNALGSVVNYNITGISKYAVNGALSGTFKADFGALTVTGYVEDASSNIAVNIGTATIGLNTAAISGTNATYSVGGSNVATGGSVDGHFFNNQDAMAGIIDFGTGSDYNTAFGGKVQ